MEARYTQDLGFIEKASEENEEENDAFRIFLKSLDSDVVDEKVHRLNAEISSRIDCMQCGNCCRSLMINVTAPDAESLSAHLHMPLPSFTEKYLEISEGGQMIVNTIPCHFLAGTICSIYEHRFEDCRQFPNLHKPGFSQRLFSTLMHYGRCPIVFNVIEKLKTELSFLTHP